VGFDTGAYVLGFPRVCLEWLSYVALGMPNRFAKKNLPKSELHNNIVFY